jgi:hypothetical protein
MRAGRGEAAVKNQLGEFANSNHCITHLTNVWLLRFRKSLKRGGGMAMTKNPSSSDLKHVLKRVKSGVLTSHDQVILSDLLGQSIKLKQLVEKSKVSTGAKKLITSLPFGFDIVK